MTNLRQRVVELQSRLYSELRATGYPPWAIGRIKEAYDKDWSDHLRHENLMLRDFFMRYE